MACTALTHLSYQLIILTLLFFNNHLLCLAFFCCQLMVLSRCLDRPDAPTQRHPDVPGDVSRRRRRPCGISRREKSVVDLGSAPECFGTRRQRAKSCIDLEDPREGSPDDLPRVEVDDLGARKEPSEARASQDHLSKSYSFPFRQKRLESWLEVRREDRGSLDVPYWQTIGYSLAVKHEARRRRRETPKKSAIGRMIRAGISNLIPARRKIHDGPSAFYPKHLPFEKERFEGDVRRKMEELDEGLKKPKD